MNRLVIHIILVFLLWNNSMAQSDTAIVKTTIDSIFNNKNILSECVIAVERYRPFDNINARNQDFNKFLQEKLPLQIKSYGSWGSVTTLSVRGTSDDQSGVIWNGVPIHSPTVGTTDLSLIPFEAVGKINFVLDYQADNLNSSSFGGMLNLTTNENVFDEFLDSNFIFKINSGFGSNGFYTQSGNIIFQNKNIISKSTVFYQFAKNDFKYSDVYKENAPKELALHNKMKNIGFMQDLNFTIPRGNIKLAAWFQQKNKELPSLMGSYDSSNKNQKDEVLRISNVYNLRLKKNELVLTGAFLQDKLRYTDKILPEDSVYFINSIIESKQFFQSAFFTLNPKSIRWNFTFGQLLNFQQANVNSYSSVPKELNGALSANLKYAVKFIKIQLGIKQEIRKTLRRPFFSASILTNTKADNPFYFAFSIAEKFRQPDMNDKYWNPGGNINLLPENGQTVDFYIAKNFNFKKHNLFIKVNPYLILIRNNIVWIPTSGIFRPDNITKTSHSGIDFTLKLFKTFSRKFYYELETIYSYNHSIIKENIIDNSIKGRFLPYKPSHILKLNFSGGWKWINWNIANQINSARFTDNSNNEVFQLAAFYLLDINVGAKWDIKNHNIGANLSILNATNTQFQSIRSYAQPGTQFLFSLNYSIHKSLKQNKNEKN